MYMLYALSYKQPEKNSENSGQPSGNYFYFNRLNISVGWLYVLQLTVLSRSAIAL